MLQDIVWQVEQGSSKVLQAVDWPQSSPDGQKNRGGQETPETPPEYGSGREVCMPGLYRREWGTAWTRHHTATSFLPL